MFELGTLKMSFRRVKYDTLHFLRDKVMGLTRHSRKKRLAKQAPGGQRYTSSEQYSNIHNVLSFLLRLSSRDKR